MVEGRYDKNHLSQMVAATIVETGGFGVFNNREKLAFFRRLAEEKGLVVFTDSDGAGFVIRNFLKGAIPTHQLKQAYIPDVYGKEKRKKVGGKEGKLGVEGMTTAVILDSLRRAGVTFLDEGAPSIPRTPITKADLMAMGLTGTPDSAQRRSQLLKTLDLPQHLTTNGMLEALNLLYSREDLFEVD